MANSTHQTETGKRAQDAPLEKLKSFLNELFQFESQDLNFGVYRILHYKRREIRQFIDKLLVDKVHEELETLSNDQAKELKQELDDLKSSSTIAGWLKAKKENNLGKLKVYEEDFAEPLREYRKLEKQVRSLRVSEGTEDQIYNHLTLFFSRYYDKGDFISKRRFGRKEKYVVPYNGEETHFYWANHDQYYVKSSENFQQYVFKVPHQNGTLEVAFKLTKAESEQGNVKSDEEKYFILSDRDAEWDGDHLTIYFEYRSLTNEEKDSLKKNGKQEGLDEQAAAVLKEKLQKEFKTHKLWEVDDQERTFLFRRLRHYTRKNSYDFFIHKDLKGFLQSELDFYIKSELVEVEDLYVSESEFHFERVRQNFKKIKVFKNIADTIIEFLDQIESFQKKLWEKKKFVIDTQWVITIDRLVEYVGEEAARPILEEVIKNEDQVREWRDLFGDKFVPENLTEVDQLKYELNSWCKYPIDTTFFSDGFKLDLLNNLSDQINLDEKSDGLVIHSDNYHGLRIIDNKYSKKIDAIYIDPPYNTSASEIIYKNSFKHSSWLTLFNNRIELTRSLFTTDGILCVTIDDFEFENLKKLLNRHFEKDLILGTIVIKNNPSGRSTTRGFSISHEYGIFCGNSFSSSIGRLEHSKKQKARYKLEDEKGPFEWVNFRRHGGATALRKSQPKAHYPFFISGSEFRIPKMDWDASKKEWIVKESPNENEIDVWPIAPNGEERVWKWEVNSVLKNIDELEVKKDSNGNLNIYRKARINVDGTLPLTVWDKKEYSATAHGTNVLISLFGSIEGFAFPKSIHAVTDSLRVSNVDSTGVILDYFAGSGTTFHSTQILNHSDKGTRKCVLIEQGHYTYEVLIPRLKKVAYSFDWKDGQPKKGSMNGLGVFFKYQRLEQYEEALENIEFTLPKEAQQQALELDNYIPKYLLEFETRDSQTLVNTENMKNPWKYELRIWDGYSYDSRKSVDLVETFNYLIGLHVEKVITREFNRLKYQFIQGVNKDNRRILVVWRNVKGWNENDFTKDREVLQSELKDFTYDQIYLNGQAHLENYMLIEEVFKNKMVS